MFSILRDSWKAPDIPQNIGHGDMPGDKIQISEEHIAKAGILFPPLKQMIANCLEQSPHSKAVLSVHGGSGVGKSEIASVLAFYLNQMGIGAYILSGDNYPRRIPRDNDLERQRVYRTGGIRGVMAEGMYDAEVAVKLKELWEKETDASPVEAETLPWLKKYQQAGRMALTDYLGTPKEIDFQEINGIIASFKTGADSIFLKRMGRDVDALWYDRVSFTDIPVLIVEWTHGNSDYLCGVDIPILLNSTPAETLAHRRARNRDGKPDSFFTTMVLQIEQKKLEEQAGKAKIILSKSGELLPSQEYRRLMAEEDAL